MRREYTYFITYIVDDKENRWIVLTYFHELNSDEKITDMEQEVFRMIENEYTEDYPIGSISITGIKEICRNVWKSILSDFAFLDIIVI